MKRYRIILVGLVLVLSLLGCAGAGGPRSSVSPTAVADATDTTPTPRPTLQAVTGTTILADGELEAVNPALALSFEAGGRLLTLTVRPGDQVAAGDLIATLDDIGLEEAVSGAELQVAQAENSLAQAQLSLDNLLNWEADETAVALAEANLTAAEAAHENAAAQDAAAGNSLTSARVNRDQAERSLADAQDAYDTAHQEARDWELNDPWRGPALEAEREATARSVAFAQENLAVARAQYNLALAGLNNDAAVSANASVISAQQALAQAQTGPKASEIAAARLQVTQAELALEQSQFSLAQARNALVKAELRAPWSGTIVSVDIAPGAMVAAGSPVVTLLDTARLQLHTSNLSERDLARVAPGQPVEIVLKAFPSQTIGGRVARIAPQASGRVGDAAVFAVIIDLDDTNLDLRPGMTGRVEITG